MAALNDSQFLCLPTVKQIDGVCVAVAGSPERQPSRLDFFFLPLDPQNKSLDEWCKYGEKHPTFSSSHAYVPLYEAVMHDLALPGDIFLYSVCGNTRIA